MANKKLSSSISTKTQGNKLEKETAPEKPAAVQARVNGLTGRGAGDLYAYGVRGLMEQAKTMQGSRTGFLGKEKVTIDLGAHCDGEMLYKKKK
jgi:hypothetical protein